MQVYNDEVNFALWKREHQQHQKSRVLKPDERVKAKYEAADWEEEYAKLRVVTPVKPDDKIAPRTLMAGITINNKAMAYPLPDLQKQRLILDNVGGKPLFMVLGDDGKSVRAFESVVEGRQLEFLVKTDAKPLQLVDAETATVWDFSGTAVSGPLAGKQLTKIQVLKDYWFDWKIYHPDTAVYTLGGRQR